MSFILHTLSNYSRQLAFAIAPIPAYLPQYYTLCNSSNDPILQRKVGHNLKKSGSFPDFAFDHNNDDTSSSTLSHGHGKSHEITEAGLSSTSIMILLISHIFRLQYFLGSAIISIFGGNSNSLGKADRVQFDLVTHTYRRLKQQHA